MTGIIPFRVDFPNASMFEAEELTQGCSAYKARMSSKIWKNPGGRLPLNAPKGGGLKFSTITLS
jgi:hypothetical protein